MVKKFIFFYVMLSLFFVTASECGDVVCDSEESLTSCPEDCSQSVSSEDFQALCGDGVCQDWEGSGICLSDCVSDDEVALENKMVMPEISNYNESGLSGWVTKILIIISVLILVGVAGFFIYFKLKKKNISSASPMKKQSTEKQLVEEVAEHDAFAK